MAVERIVLLSDNHRYWDDQLTQMCEGADQIWHAGDLGSMQVLENMEAIAPTKAVWGNIDNSTIRSECPEEHIFTIQGLKIFIRHIGGYPPKYTTKLRSQLDDIHPDLFICGHSHILKVMPDKKRKLLHMNPGACGKHGFHNVRTLLRFNIEDGKICKPEAVELGER